MTRCELERPSGPRKAPAGRSPARPTGPPRANRGIAALAIVLAGLGSVFGDDVPERPISEVRIEGRQSISEEKIRERIVSRVGRLIDRRTVEKDIGNLRTTHWFSDVKAFWTDDPKGKGVVLIFQVAEMPILTELEFRGRKNIKQKDLEETTGLKLGARADNVVARTAVGRIQRLYEEKGYEMADVRLIEGGNPGDTRVILSIFEGPKVKLSKVDFEGNTFVSDAVLATQISSRAPILGLGGKYHKDEVPVDTRKLIDYYNGLGFLEAKITPITRQGANVGEMRLTFVVSEGIRYKVRDITFDGNEKIKTADLKTGLRLHSGEPFNDSVREADLKNLRSKYSEIGCIDIHIDTQHKYLDQPGVIDMVYKIDEGERYLVGAINFWGNEHTKDDVLRREAINAGLVPGQPLNGNQLEVLKKRLTALRYFQNSPEMGKPLDIRISRHGTAPYTDTATQSLDEVVRTNIDTTRLQNADEPAPPINPPAGGPPPGDVARFGPNGEVDGLPEALPAIPAPVAPVGPGVPGPPGTALGAAPSLAPPVGAGEPPGTFPSTPGSNATDVGPDRNEPFSNRSFNALSNEVDAPPRNYADLDVSVDEAPTGQFMLGVGATSYGGLNGNLILHERNFDIFAVPRSFQDVLSGRAFRGAGQELRIQISPGTLINSFVISFREPYLYLFGTPYGFNASTYGFTRIYPDWNEKRLGARYSLGRQFGTSIYADVAARAELVNFSGYRSPAPADYLAASGDSFLASLRPSLRYDNRNDPYAPSKGQYLEAAYEYGFGTFQFSKATIEGRQHFTLGQRPDGNGKRILTARGFFGVTGRDTPVYERFFAGDFRSMRGFAYRGVGPRINGSNIGGIMSAIGSVEYQWPWTANDKFQQVVFCDFGTVESDYKFTEFRAAVGTGLRVIIPQFGPLPLAFDLAFPVSKVDGDKTRYFTFFIGAFW